MHPVSADFLATVVDSHVAISRAEAYLGGELVCVVPVESGSVTSDARRSILRTCTLEIAPGEGLSLDELYATLSYVGCEIKLYRGIALPTRDEYVPLGVYGNFELGDTNQPKLSLNGSDRGKRIARKRLSDPYVIASGTALAEGLADLLLDRWPACPIGFSATDTGGAVIGAQVVLDPGSDSDPWRDARSIAEAHGLDLYFDGEGIARLRLIPDAAQSPAAMRYRAGEASVLIDRTRNIASEQIYSGVIASGEGTGVTVPVRGEAWDLDPASPTFADGVFGRVPYFYSSPLLTTQDAADSAAATLLSRVTGRTEQIAWTQIVNPAHDALDVVELEQRDGTVLRYILDEVTIPLAVTDVMSATARETRAAAAVRPVAVVDVSASLIFVSGLVAAPGDGKITYSGYVASGGAVAFELYVSADPTSPTDATVPTITAITAATVDATGLTDGVTYHAWMRAVSATGARGPWSMDAAATPVDSSVPVLSGALVLTPGAGQVALDWTDATDNVGVVGYDVERATDAGFTAGVAAIAPDPTASAAVFTGLAEETLYYFRVRAYDANGNTSAWITASSKPADTTAPSQVTGLAATNGDTQSVLTWDAATDARGVTAYDVYKDGAYLATVSALTYTATGLTNGTTYSFTVRAKDAAGNVGAASAAASATPAGSLMLVAGGGGTNSLATSPDGITWTGRGNIAGMTVVNGAARGGSTWVIVGGTNPNIAYSTDGGANWIGLGYNTAGIYIGKCVAWSGSLWVAGGNDASSYATSPDGITWTGRGLLAGMSTVYGVAWNGSMWVALGYPGIIATSPDGLTWTSRNTTLFSYGYGAAWSGSQWVAVGNGSSHCLATSPDGITWTGRGKSVFGGSGAKAVAWNGSTFMAVGDADGSSPVIATSPDGITWTGRGIASLFDVNGAYGVTWTGSLWVVVGHSASGAYSIATSPDGITWTSRARPFTTSGYCVARN